MILLIDNCDSFAGNLARYVAELGFACRIERNDALDAEQAFALRPRAIILSSGPGTPDEAGVCLQLARLAAERSDMPVLGVGLGHQAIAEALGGRLRHSRQPRHGVQARILHGGCGLFAGLPQAFAAGCRHSLTADIASAAALQATARDEDGALMALAHQTAPLFGVQFQPESILTAHGHRLLANFLSLAGLKAGKIPQQAA